MTTENSSSNLELEHLFSAAFARTKARFLSYFLTWLMFLAYTIGVVLATGLLSGVAAVIYGVTKSIPVTATLGVIIAIAYVVAIFYLGAWSMLTSTMILISEKAIGLSEAMKQAKPLIGKYIGFSVLFSLFMLGIISFSGITLYILAVVWGIWSAFTIFIFIEGNTTGLQAMWTSKEMVSKKFWPVFGRLIMVYIALYALMFSITYASETYKALNLVSLILSLFAGPFILSYTYEIYKNLPAVTGAKRSIGWIVAAVIGWVMLIALLVFAVNAAASAPKKMNVAPMQQYDWQKVRPS